MYLLRGLFFVLLSFHCVQNVHAFDEFMHFKLEGRVPHLSNGYIYISYRSSSGFKKDTIELRSRKFTYSGEILHPTFLRIAYSATGKKEESSKWMTIYIEGGKNIVLIYKEHIKVRKSVTDREYRNYLHSVSDIENKIEFFSNDIQELRNHFESDSLKNKIQEERLTISRRVLDSLNRIKLQKEIDFISRYLKSYVSGYILLYTMDQLSEEKLHFLYKDLGDNVKNSDPVKFVKKRIKGLVGNMAEEFEAIDSKGDSIKLSAITTKKYVLLDFWATWCIPCRADFSHLKKIYNKYSQSGFEIIGIARDDKNIEGWKAAILEDGINLWIHVLEGLEEKNLGYNYGVMPIPVKILIDRNGIIIGRWEGSSELNKKELDEMLYKIFNF